MKNIIITKSNCVNKAMLELYEDNKLNFKVDAYIGKNGMANNKREGDFKTPKGLYDIGIIFGTHKRNELNLSEDITYVELNDNLYWIDDVNSKYYNKMVDITKLKKDWNSAEHLIKYAKQYEYAIEIKANPINIPGKRKCDFFTL